MRNLFKTVATSLLVAAAAIFTSCDKEGNDILRKIEDEIKDTTGVVDPVKKDFNLIVNPTNEGKPEERNIIVTKPAGEFITVNANFKGSKSMYRLYMTRHLIGNEEGVQPYEYALGDKKKDGSINLQQQDKEEFTFVFDFDAPQKDGQVVQYVLWATTGRGDFRDINKRNAVGDSAVGVVTIKAGTEETKKEDIESEANINGIKSFRTIILGAPLADKSSSSFLSVYNGKKYQIKDGDETAALWDFGYYYGYTNKASLASSYAFPKSVIDVPSISGILNENLNHFYIAKSSLNFENADYSVLENITMPSSEAVKNLSIGDVLEFQDQYGAKGLIKVVDIAEGFGTDASITIDIKVQNFNAIKG